MAVKKMVPILRLLHKAGILVEEESLNKHILPFEILVVEGETVSEPEIEVEVPGKVSFVLGDYMHTISVSEDLSLEKVFVGYRPQCNAIVFRDLPSSNFNYKCTLQDGHCGPHKCRTRLGQNHLELFWDQDMRGDLKTSYHERMKKIIEKAEAVHQQAIDEYDIQEARHQHEMADALFTIESLRNELAEVKKKVAGLTKDTKDA